jgi:hypothetical protein
MIQTGSDPVRIKVKSDPNPHPSEKVDLHCPFVLSALLMSTSSVLAPQTSKGRWPSDLEHPEASRVKIGRSMSFLPLLTFSSTSTISEMKNFNFFSAQIHLPRLSMNFLPSK